MVPGIGATGDTLVGLFDIGQYDLAWVADTAGDTTSSSQTVAMAAFVDTSSYEFAMAGTCTINSTTISQSDVNDTYWEDSVSFTPNGSMNTYTVSGAGSIPSFTDSLASPSGVTRISSPSVGDTVSRSSNLTVTWNTGTADTVRLYVVGPDTNGVDSRRIDFTVPNNGSYTIPSSYLSGFATGNDLALTVARINYKKVAHPNSRQYVMIAHSDHMISCPLAD